VNALRETTKRHALARARGFDEAQEMAVLTIQVDATSRLAHHVLER
jgi:hypothetical protein